jgi:hypothetical protein
MTRSSLARIASLMRIDVLILLSFVSSFYYFITINSKAILTDMALDIKR